MASHSVTTRHSPSDSPRRGLRLPAAALYIGVGQTTFLAWAKAGIMPQPIRKGGVVLWDIRALDLAFDDLPEDAAPAVNTWAHLDDDD